MTTIIFFISLSILALGYMDTDRQSKEDGKTPIQKLKEVWEQV